MAVSQGQLAKHWGITQQAVSKLVKQGCPLNSLRAATLWRKARGRKRAPTNSHPNSDAKLKKRGRPKNPRKPSRTGDSLQDALNNAIAISDDAFVDYQEARVSGNKLERRSLLAEHSKALEVRMTTEKAYREEMERREILVPVTEMGEKFRRVLDAILRPLKKLPIETSPQCAMKEALAIREIMDRKVAEIIKAGNKAASELLQ
jgi:hypothetical protein